MTFTEFLAGKRKRIHRHRSTPAEFIANFKAGLVEKPSTGCMEWTGYKNANGYGHITRAGAKILAHRLAWLLEHGEIPSDKRVLHRCDNPACANPAHLFLGTPKDNSTDMVEKGRASRGEAHPRAKLTAEAVIMLRGTHCSAKLAAEQFGVSVPTVNHIRQGRTWKHLLPKAL